MKHTFITAISMIVFLLFVVTIGVMPSSAQQPTPTPSAPTTIPDIEQKISALERTTFQLEVTQTQLIESVRSNNEQNRSLLTVFGAFIGLLVAMQGIITFVQLRREGKRNRLENIGVSQVSEIMGVVKDTIASRLDAEREAREEAKRIREQLDKVLGEVESLDQFVKNFQTNIQNSRRTIEDTASRWAQGVSRHDFRGMTNELNDFARQFDKFKVEFEPLEEKPHPEFSARVLYIRGITAHYANQPEIAKRYLTQVAEFQQPETDETEIAYNRRVANAYYYLGLTESNFGNHQDAIDYFDNANRRDLQNRDFLTRVVTAEAYSMINDYGEAKHFIKEVEDGLFKIERAEGRLRNFHLRLRSRAGLIRANIAILGRDTNWHEEAQQLLEPIHVADPQYYYVTTTLAQVHAYQKNFDDAKKLFREAYETIERSGDFLTVMEVRSQILLRMVAGMCCKYIFEDENRAEEHLDRADSLLGRLPKIDHQTCTVFSILSKRNEGSEAIRHHIDLIQKGNVLLELGK